MYRLNINKKQMGDLIVLLLFDKSFDESFLQESELFNQLRDLIKQKGLKSKLFQMYFDVSPDLRSKYKQFSKKIEEQNASIMIKEDNQNEGYEEQLITEVVKRVTGKERPNEKKLQQLIEDILKEEELY